MWLLKCFKIHLKKFITIFFNQTIQIHLYIIRIKIAIPDIQLDDNSLIIANEILTFFFTSFNNQYKKNPALFIVIFKFDQLTNITFP